MPHKSYPYQNQTNTQWNPSLATLISLFTRLRDYDAEFPLHYALCLLLIARKEGVCLTDIVRETGLAMSTVSRIVGALSDNRQKGVPYKLVEVQISVEERRRKELFLTPEGRDLVTSMCEAVGKI